MYSRHIRCWALHIYSNENIQTKCNREECKAAASITYWSPVAPLLPSAGITKTCWCHVYKAVMKSKACSEKTELSLWDSDFIGSFQNHSLLPLYSLPDFNAIIPIIVVGDILFAVHPFSFDLIREAEWAVSQILHCFLNHLYMSSSTCSICLQEEWQDMNIDNVFFMLRLAFQTPRRWQSTLVNLFLPAEKHISTHKKYQTAEVQDWTFRFHTILNWWLWGERYHL